MNYIEIVLIAVSLAMDSFAVSISSGVIIHRLKFKHVLKIALYMGMFQAFMPLLGWLAGSTMRRYIESYDHWIAFCLLLLLGTKMIFEHFKSDEQKEFDPTKHFVLVGLAVATSIDALVVGVNFALLGLELLLPVVVIGITAFLFSFVGVFLGDRVGDKFDFKAELIGGIVLIGIGIKILLDHLYFSC